MSEIPKSLDPELGPDPGLWADPEADPGADPEIDPEVEPEVEPGAETGAGAGRGQEQERRRKERTRAERSRVIEKYESTGRFGKETRKFVDRALDQEIEQAHIEFAQDWFRDNREKIEEAGYDPDNEELAYVMRVTNEMKGFQELEEGEEYQKTREGIDNLSVLQEELERRNIPIDSQYLMLNALNRRAERIEDEIEQAQGAGKREVARVKKQELEDLFNVRKEIAEKISAKDLTEEARRGLSLRGRITGAERRRVEEMIREIGESPERAVQGIEGVYQAVKERLAAEYIKEKLKRDQGKEVKEIDKEFNGEGIDFGELFREMRRLAEEGTLDQDAILGLLREQGIDEVDPKDFTAAERETMRERVGKVLEKAEKMGSGIFTLLLLLLTLACRVIEKMPDIEEGKKKIKT